MSQSPLVQWDISAGWVDWDWSVSPGPVKSVSGNVGRWV